MRSFLIAVMILLAATLASAAPRNRRDVSHLSQPHQYYHHERQSVVEPLSEKQSFQLTKVNYGSPFRPTPEPIVDPETDPLANEIVDSYGNPIVDAELISLRAAQVPTPHTEYGVPIKEYVREESHENDNAASEVDDASVPFYHVSNPVGFQAPFEQYQYAQHRQLDFGGVYFF